MFHYSNYNKNYIYEIFQLTEHIFLHQEIHHYSCWFLFPYLKKLFIFLKHKLPTNSLLPEIDLSLSYNIIICIFTFQFLFIRYKTISYARNYPKQWKVFQPPSSWFPTLTVWNLLLFDQIYQFLSYGRICVTSQDCHSVTLLKLRGAIFIYY